MPTPSKSKIASWKDAGGLIPIARAAEPSEFARTMDPRVPTLATSASTPPSAREIAIDLGEAWNPYGSGAS
jgi:hypothetical protein